MEYQRSCSVQLAMVAERQRSIVTQVEDSFDHATNHSFILGTSSAIDAGIKLRPNAEDLKTMPEFEERWKTYFANSPDKPIMLLGTLAS